MSDDAAQTLLYCLLLVLPVSALVARRLPLGETARLAIIWIALFGLAAVIADILL